MEPVVVCRRVLTTVLCWCLFCFIAAVSPTPGRGQSVEWGFEWGQTGPDWPPTCQWKSSNIGGCCHNSRFRKAGVANFCLCKSAGFLAANLQPRTCTLQGQLSLQMQKKKQKKGKGGRGNFASTKLPLVIKAAKLARFVNLQLQKRPVQQYSVEDTSLL